LPVEDASSTVPEAEQLRVAVTVSGTVNDSTNPALVQLVAMGSDDDALKQVVSKNEA